MQALDYLCVLKYVRLFYYETSFYQTKPKSGSFAKLTIFKQVDVIFSGTISTNSLFMLLC
jgi:hypothetical protein